MHFSPNILADVRNQAQVLLSKKDGKSQTRAKRSALFEQVSKSHQHTDVHESITKQDRNNINDPQKKHRLGTINPFLHVREACKYTDKGN